MQRLSNGKSGSSAFDAQRGGERLGERSGRCGPGEGVCRNWSSSSNPLWSFEEPRTKLTRANGLRPLRRFCALDEDGGTVKEVLGGSNDAPASGESPSPLV